jgi:hypothetical protein
LITTRLLVAEQKSTSCTADRIGGCPLDCDD